MLERDRNLVRVGLAVVFLVGAVLACTPPSGGNAVTVVINGPANGSSVAVGQEVLVDSTASAGAGVARVELSVGGVVVRRDVPPSGNPTAFRVSQPWTPTTEGQATISVVAYDVNGNSSNVASITLQVVSSSGVVPTEPGATAVPGATDVPPATGPTETPPPPVTTEAGCTVGSQYVSDVTIPDGTIMSPGAGFVKTWRVRNSGTCDWDSSYRLIFVGGEQMGGPPSVPLSTVPAGGQTDISVSLTAPSAYGTHKGTWRIQSDEGIVFGTNLTVLVDVPAPATDTPVPTGTPLPTEVPTDVPTDVPTLPLPAIAPYIEEVGEHVLIPAGDTGSVTAVCPSGSVVVGGGYASSVDMLVYNHSMNGNGWRAYAKNNASTSKQLNAYAICLFGAPGATTTQVFQQAQAPAGGKGHPVATCPAGSIVTGGGWAGRADGSLRIYNSSQSGNGWQVWADNVSASSKPVNAYAICLSGFSGTTAQLMESASIPGGGNEGVVATCSSGDLVTSGGFAAQEDLVMKTSHRNNDSSWITYATNIGSADKLIFSYVTCLTP